MADGQGGLPQQGGQEGAQPLQQPQQGGPPQQPDQIQQLQQQLQHLQAQMNDREERRQTENLKLYQGALRSLPIFSAEKGEGWRSHALALASWARANQIDRYTVPDQRKMAILKSLRGKALRAQELYGISTQAYQDAPDWDQYLELIKSVFLPMAESNMSRIEFESRKQQVNEPIGSYLSEKMSLYRNYTPVGGVVDQNTWNYFRREALSGIYSKTVMQKLIEKSPANFQELQQQALETVGNIREAFSMGANNVANLDGLASSTSYSQSRYEEAMEIGSLNSLDVKNKKCERCNNKGHTAAKCWARKGKADFNTNKKDTKPKEGKPKKGNCHFCGIEGHFKSECRKWAKEKGDKKDKKESNKGDTPKKHIRKVEGSEEGSETEECEQFGDGATLNVLNGPSPFRAGAAATKKHGSRPSKIRSTWQHMQ